MNGDERSELGVRRSVLCSAGPAGRVVAERITRLSAAWLGCPPPLAVLDLDRAGTAAQQAALDALADAHQAERLRRSGLITTHPDEVTLWLVADALPPGDEADQGPTADMDAAAAFINQLRDQAWQRLRANLRPYALLLAEPAAGSALGAWGAALIEAGVEQVFLAGPVNVSRERCGTADWLPRAATAVAVLLWQDELPLRRAFDGSLLALGGSAWQGDHAALRAALRATLVSEALARLTQEPGPRGDLYANDAVAPPTSPWVLPALDAAGLVETIPAPPPAGLWRRRQPSLALLQRLPEQLAADAARQHTTYRQSAYTWRERWLEERIRAGETQLLGEEAHCLGQPDRWPQVGAWVRLAGQRKAEVMAALARLEDDLEAAGCGRTAAEAACEDAQGKLKRLIASLPPPGWHAAVAALLQPWRWLNWAWTYFITLPRAVQRVLDAYAAAELAAWREGNVHLARQALLALAQSAGQRLAAAEQAWRLLIGAAEAAAQDTPSHAVWPWSAAELDRVVAWLLSAQAGAVETPTLGGWLEGLGAAPGDERALLARVQAWAERLTARMAWTSAQQAAAALDEPELAAWLDALYQEAEPLWPAERQPGAPDRGALSDGAPLDSCALDQLVGRPASQAPGTVGYGARGGSLPADAPLERWRKARPGTRCRETVADIVAWVRMAPVSRVELPHSADVALLAEEGGS